jgi:hypothetical protein
LRLLWLHTIFLSPSNNASKLGVNTLQIILIKGSSPGHHQHNPHQVTLSYLSGQPATPPDSNPDENMKGSPTPTDLTLLQPLNPQPHPPPPPPTHSSIYNSSSSSPSGLPSFLGQFNPANNNAAGRLSSSCHHPPLNSFNKSQFYHFGCHDNNYFKKCLASLEYYHGYHPSAHHASAAVAAVTAAAVAAAHNPYHHHHHQHHQGNYSYNYMNVIGELHNNLLIIKKSINR